MTGYHSVVVMAEAHAKGFPGIELAKAYPIVRKRALEDDYQGLDFYRKLGFIPCDREAESVSKTLDYAYDDWAAAYIARALGVSADSARLLKALIITRIYSTSRLRLCDLFRQMEPGQSHSARLR